MLLRFPAKVVKAAQHGNEPVPASITVIPDFETEVCDVITEQELALVHSRGVEDVLGPVSPEASESVTEPVLGDDEVVPSKPKRKPINTAFKRNKYYADWTPWDRHPMPGDEVYEEVLECLQQSAPKGKLEIFKNSNDFDQDIGPMHGSGGFDIHGIFKIILSARTSNGNAISAENDVCRAYPYNVDGKAVVTKIPNFYDIMTGSEEKLQNAMKKAGLYITRGIRFKRLLNKIYAENCDLAKRELPMTNKAGATDFVEGEGLSLGFLRSQTPQHVFDYFIKVEGFGLKLTQCVLAFKMKFPTYTVDTHAMKGAQALGWVPESVNVNEGSIQCDIASHMDFHLPDALKHAIHQGFWYHRQTCKKCKGYVRQGTAEWHLPENKCAIEHLVVHWPAARSEKTANTKKRKAEKEDEEDGEQEKKPKGLRRKRVYTQVNGVKKIKVGRTFDLDTYSFGQMTATEAYMHNYKLEEYDIDGDFGSGEAKTGTQKKWVKVKAKVEITKKITTKITITAVEQEGDEVSVSPEEDDEDDNSEEE